MDVCEAIEPSALMIVNVAQKAKDVLVEPVLLLIAKVKGFVIVEPGVQVSQGALGNVALTSKRSFDVHELGKGKVCADTIPEKNKVKKIKILVNALILKAQGFPVPVLKTGKPMLLRFCITFVFRL